MTTESSISPYAATEVTGGWCLPAAPAPPILDVAGYVFGPPCLALIAGPCSVKNLEQTLRVARRLALEGATWFRAGIFKPRTEPGKFQGLGVRGIPILQEVRAQTGMVIATEVLDPRQLELALAIDGVVVQIGARNMQNFELLKEVGRAGCPVILKRGFCATIAETIGAADYVRSEGNLQVILCERGMRTFETAYRFTLDLAAVPILKQRAGLPVIVDPSHAAGRRDLVPALSKAAVAVGADGLLVEVDENPDEALSDPAQQLDVETFAGFVRDIEGIAAVEGRRVLRARDRG